MIETKKWYQSTTTWINALTFIIMFISSQSFAVTFWGSFAIFALNDVLSVIKNDSEIKTVINLPIGIFWMKAAIITVNTAGIGIELYQYIVQHSPDFHPAVWMTMTISFFTLLVRVLTSQKQ